MKKPVVIIGISVISILALATVFYFVFSDNSSQQASASVNLPANTNDMAIYKGTTYYKATYVKNLLKPSKASANVFVISNNQIYPTDGIKRDKTDTTAPGNDQVKIELARGYFYLAYKDYPNSLSEIPEAKRTDVYAYESKLFYNTGSAISNNMSLCTKGGKTYVAATVRNGSGACDMLGYGYGMLIDLQGSAKKILTEKAQPEADQN